MLKLNQKIKILKIYDKYEYQIKIYWYDRLTQQHQHTNNISNWYEKTNEQSFKNNYDDTFFKKINFLKLHLRTKIKTN